MPLVPVTLEQLKLEALKRGHSKIRREGELDWHSIADWTGHRTSNGMHYLRDGSKVVAVSTLEGYTHRYVLD